MPKPLDMARAGFFYVELNNSARCFFCGQGITGWNYQDSPWIEHARWSPNCLFLEQQKGKSFIQDIQKHKQREEETIRQQNIQAPIQPALSQEHLSSVQQNTTNNTCPQLTSEASTNSNQNNRTPDISQHDNVASANQNQSNNPPLNQEHLKRIGFNFDVASHSKYETISSRRASLVNWISQPGISINAIAKAGFFYPGNGDSGELTCFFCNGTIYNWQANDDPWIKHAKAFPQCFYLKSNTEKEFINRVHDFFKTSDRGPNGMYTLPPPQKKIVNNENLKESHFTPTLKMIINPIDYDCIRVAGEIYLERNLPLDLSLFYCKDYHLQNLLIIINELILFKKLTLFLQDYLNKHITIPFIEHLQRINCGFLCDKSDEYKAENFYNFIHNSSPIENQLKNLQLPEALRLDIQNGTKEIFMKISEYNFKLEHPPENSQIATCSMDEAQILNEWTKLREKLYCTICLENRSTVSLLPCGHLVCCKDCAPAMRKCPECKETVMGTVKVHFDDRHDEMTSSN